MGLAVEALLQRGPGAPEPPDEAAERLVSRRPDMGMDPEQEQREHAVALAKAVETTAANGLSAGGGARLHEILDRYWNAFQRGDPPISIESLTVTFKPEAKVVKARGHLYSPIKTRAWQHALEPWSCLGWCFAICRLCGLVWRWLRPRREGFAW